MRKDYLDLYNTDLNGKKSISRSQFNSMRDELYKLKKIDRKDVARQIKEAREKGNLSNSPEYEAAKKRQSDMEKRIQVLESQINAAGLRIVDDTPESVSLGHIVKIYDEEYEEYVKYSIVKSEDANSLQGKISDDSPLGKALIGAQVGSRVKVTINGYTSCYRVDSVVGFEKKYLEHYLKDKKPEKGKSIVKKSVEKETKEITAKHFLTRVNIFHCTSEDHVLVDIWCKVDVLKRNGAIEKCTVPGAYCETCDKYFILENQFENLRKKGVLICKIVESDYWNNKSHFKKGYAGMNSESILHMMGYNVNAQADLTKMQRWRILEIAVEQKILSSMEVCSHLQWLINRSANLKNYADARDKWNVDLNHIANYTPVERKEVKVSGITVKKKRK